MTKSNISEVLQLQETKIHKNLMMTFYRFYILQKFCLNVQADSLNIIIIIENTNIL